MNINLRHSKACISYLGNNVMQLPVNQQNELIQYALACLENRILYLSEPLTHPYEVRNFLRLQLGRENNEVFAVIFLSNSHRVLGFERLFFGTIGMTTVHPRVIVQRALEYNAAAIIIAHNHPSGSLEPSSADQYITMQIQSALNLVDVRLLDHFIVTQEAVLSFAERGLI